MTPLQQDYAKYEYTWNGQRKAVIDANGNRAEMTYDGFDRQKRWIFPSNTPGYANQADYEEYGYDPIGNRTSYRKRDGSVLSYQYDALNRVIRKIVPERSGLTAAQTRDVYYDYNHALGLQTKARFDALDGYGVTQYYDLFGLPTTVLLNMDGNARYTSYYHDDGGRLARLTHPDGAHFYYQYDALARPTSILDGPSTSLDDYVIRYWYNSAGGRHSAVRGAGSGGYYSVYHRDPLQRLSLLANDLPVAADHSIELAYNPASQIVGRTLSNDSYATPPAYDVSRAYAVNGLNQYTSAGPATFTYDSNGNLTSDGTTSYTYDVENRLVASSAGASLVYDPLGRLFQISGGVAGATRFNYDGDKLIAEYSGSTLLRRYVHGPGADEPVAVYEGAGLGLAGRRYTMPDERGSIVGLVNADGTPSACNRYDAWGIPGSGNQGRFQYTGQAWLPELGMYYYKARIYSPTLGRFLQVDPIGYEDQINLYGYVANDPINNVDPTGTDCVVKGKMTYCDYTGSRIPVSFPTPPGFKSFTTSDRDAHKYDKPVEDKRGSALPAGRKSSRASAVASAIAGNPTPGIDKPATPEGTRNDANPYPGVPGTSSPVLSYLRRDESGRPVTVNVTQPGHPLGMGIVVRWVEVRRDGRVIVHNEGQGVGFLQSRSSPGIIRNAINGVWIGTTQETLDQ